MHLGEDSGIIAGFRLLTSDCRWHYDLHFLQPRLSDHNPDVCELNYRYRILIQDHIQPTNYLRLIIIFFLTGWRMRTTILRRCGKAVIEQKPMRTTRKRQ